MRIDDPKRGFTLIELLVVISIIGILSAMAVAGMGGKVAEERTRGAAESAKAFLQRVTAEVKKNQKVYSVSFAPDRIVAYDSSGCVSSKEVFDEPIDAPIALIEQAASVAGPTDIAAGSAWNTTSGNCLEFVVKVGENPVATPGWLALNHTQRTNFQTIVMKTASDNRFRVFLSVNGGTAWRAL